MKKSLLIAMALAVFAVAPAGAADLAPRPYVKAPEPMPIPTWTGFYVGVNGGYGWGQSTWSNLVSTVDSDPAVFANVAGTFTQHNTTGWLGGFQWGYDRQFGQWVLGAGSDFDWTGISGNSPCMGSFGDAIATCGTSMDWISTSTARLGLAMGPFLPYIKGGFAIERSKFTATNISYGNSDYLPTKSIEVGWVAGAGGEFKIAPNWSVFAEYNYMDFGTNRVGFTPSAITGNGITSNFSADIHQTVSVVKVGLNYRAMDLFGSFLH